MRLEQGGIPRFHMVDSSGERSGRPASAGLHKSPETCRVLVPTAPESKGPKWEPRGGAAGNQSGPMLPTPPLGLKVGRKVSGFSKAGETRVLPDPRSRTKSGMHSPGHNSRCSPDPGVRQPRPPLSRREAAELRGGLPRRSPSRIDCSQLRPVGPGALSTRAILSIRVLHSLAAFRGTPRSPPAPALPWPSSAASTRLSAPYRAARPGAAPSERIVAAVTPPIASPGPTPAAPCPGPPPAALRLPPLLLNRSGQLFSGCSLGPIDPAPRVRPLQTRPLQARPLHPPDPPASGPARGPMAGGCGSAATALDAQASERGPGEGAKGPGSLESSPPAAATSGRPLLRAGDICNSQARAAVEELGRGTIQWDVCPACTARGKAPANPTSLEDCPGHAFSSVQPNRFFNQLSKVKTKQRRPLTSNPRVHRAPDVPRESGISAHPRTYFLPISQRSLLASPGSSNISTGLATLGFHLLLRSAGNALAADRTRRPLGYGSEGFGGRRPRPPSATSSPNLGVHYPVLSLIVRRLGDPSPTQD
nr:proline-rich protein 36-like [Meriones unguiculatus]